MEQLLFILFVLFSVISALLERRKRKRALEEATGANPSTAPAADDDKEEDVDGWPFPMGGADPFEPRSRRSAPPQEVALAVDEGQAEEAEEERADSQQDTAREAVRAAQQIQAKHRVDELVRKRLAATTAAEEARPGSRSKRVRWKLSAKEARRAFVYAEIIGLPKSLKDD